MSMRQFAFARLCVCVCISELYEFPLNQLHTANGIVFIN